MARLIAAFIIGLGLGAGIVVLVTKPAVEPESTSPAFPVIESPTDATATRPQASQAMPLADIQSLPSEFERRSALYARLQSTDVGTLEILLDEVDDLSNPGRFKHILYSRYLQLDPRAALRRLGEEDRDQQVLIPTTVWAAASLDLDAALAFVDTLDGAVRNRSARNILDLDGLSDAKKEEIAKRFGLEAYLWEFRATSQARTDPAGAWQTALAIEEDGGRRQALHIVAEIWLETDPPAALSALASIEYRETGSWQKLTVAPMGVPRPRCRTGVGDRAARVRPTRPAQASRRGSRSALAAGDVRAGRDTGACPSERGRRGRASRLGTIRPCGSSRGTRGDGRHSQPWRKGWGFDRRRLG